MESHTDQSQRRGGMAKAGGMEAMHGSIRRPCSTDTLFMLHRVWGPFFPLRLRGLCLYRIHDDHDDETADDDNDGDGEDE